MRKVLAVIFLLSLSAFAQSGLPVLGSTWKGGSSVSPAISLVTTCNSITSGASCTVTSIPAGHTIAVVVQDNAVTNTFTVADGGDTFTQTSNALLSGCGISQDIWYVLSAGSPRTAITVTTSGGGNWFGTVYDLTGVTAFDISNHVSSAANPNTPLTTANAVEALVGVEAANTSVTAVTAPWTQQATINTSGWGSLITSSNGTYSMPFTSGGGTFCGSAAAFR